MHFVLLGEIIGLHLAKVTEEKLYGKYSHNLLVHAPLQFRIKERKIFQYNKKYNTIHKFISSRPYN